MTGRRPERRRTGGAGDAGLLVCVSGTAPFRRKSMTQAARPVVGEGGFEPPTSCTQIGLEPVRLVLTRVVECI
jgi:hypothetical protein